MKFRAPRIHLLLLLGCFGLLIQAAPAQNPLKSIGSRLKKVGSVLTPWKKSAATTAPKAVPVAAKPDKPVKTAARPAAKPVKSTASKKSKKSTSSSTAGTKSKTAAATAATAAVAGQSADAPDPTASPESPPESSALADGNPPGAEGDAPPPAVESAPLPPLAEIPFGTPVMGRKGYVRSPFAETQGMVDVTDIPAGTKVKCPFTTKIFRVP